MKIFHFRFSNKHFQPSPARIFIGILMGSVMLSGSGCGRRNPPQQIDRGQAAIIDELNREIERLNRELGQALQSRQNLLQAKEELEDKLQRELASGNMALSMEDRGLVVTVLDRVLFDSGRADLKMSAMTSLDTMAEVLEEKVSGHMIYIEGHTDNVPIRFSNWRSNWELSTARATEVIHYFVDNRSFRPERLAAVGYGEFQPIASNRSPEGRLMNRRVEIVISPKKFGEAGGSPAA